MAKIPLRRRDGTLRGFAIVDEDDYPALSQHVWHADPKGYVVRSVYLGKTDDREVRELEMMHRRLMGLVKGDGLQVDHINRDKLDNRRSNLRVVGAAENPQNVSGGHGLSRRRNVHWIKARNRWAVRVCHNGKWYLGGHFIDPEEAARAAAELRARVFTHAVN